MKLLILTQKVDLNDDVLGFFHSWLFEFAKNCEKIIVICLEKGEHELPKNVKVLSLGKDKINFQFSIFNFQSIFNLKIFRKAKYLGRFYKYILQERNNYDTVFVHMNPEYVVLGGFFWKLWRKKIILWYNHREVNFKLRIAEKLSDKIFTVAKESFRIKSKKVNIAGHGIDLSKLKIKNENLKVKGENFFKIIYVGRISKIKNQKLLVEAADILINKEKTRNLKFQFIGAPIVENDRIYFNELTNLAAEKNISPYLEFAGSVSCEKIFEEYGNADLSINLCPTGGLDKAVLESMACGCIVVAFNKAFENILPKELILNTSDKNELAEKIKWAINLNKDQRDEMRKRMIQEIEKNHNLTVLIKRIIDH